jgi:hypothetical protein
MGTLEMSTSSRLRFQLQEDREKVKSTNTRKTCFLIVNSVRLTTGKDRCFHMKSDTWNDEKRDP